jgi:hypothetical protein
MIQVFFYNNILKKVYIAKMSTNTTEAAAVTITPVTKSALLLNEAQYMIIYRAFYYAFFPTISVLGIACNLTSIILLTRKGFKKSSNILLLSLAVCDILFLIGLNNFPHSDRNASCKL